VIRPDALALLRASELSGNAREVERVVVGVAAVRRTGDVTAADLCEIEVAGPRHLTALQRSERELIINALAYAGGNKRAAAKELGISRTTLYRRIEEYRIDAPQAPARLSAPGGPHEWSSQGPKSSSMPWSWPGG
jgi:transcriptional regulator of acetoin/glycerol metabolism